MVVGAAGRRGDKGAAGWGLRLGHLPAAKPPIPSANPVWNPQNQEENLTQCNGVLKAAGIAPIHHFLLFFFLNFPLLAVELQPVWRGCSPSASRCSCWVFSGTAGICSHKTPQWDELGHRGVAIRMDSASRASSGLLLLMELLQLSRCHPASLRCHPALEMWFQ